jgi:nitrate reductase molybdenum cofactor assembly chaperone NarJ/NarW
MTAAMTGTAERTAWQLQSTMLAYPDAGFAWHLELVSHFAPSLPSAVAQPLLQFAGHAGRTPLTELAADYVSTFDHRRRCCLYLTYYQHGDTRNRGIALLKLKHAYRRAGLNLSDEELPDHLGVVLEFIAHSEVENGRALLLEHRAGVELLRIALADVGSPWRHVLDSVCATLPALRGDQHDAIARLAADGPPQEQVGLAPFAPPEYMPEPVRGTR